MLGAKASAPGRGGGDGDCRECQKYEEGAVCERMAQQVRARSGDKQRLTPNITTPVLIGKIFHQGWGKGGGGWLEYIRNLSPETSPWHR